MASTLESVSAWKGISGRGCTVWVCDAHEADSVHAKSAPTGLPPGRRFAAPQNHMSTHVPEGGKSTAHGSEAQTHCRDCPHARGHHSAERAQTDAHDHADITGHTIEVEADQFSRPLVVVGELEVGE